MIYGAPAADWTEGAEKCVHILCVNRFLNFSKF